MTVKEYLEQNNINLTELAKTTGIPISCLSKIKNGRLKITESMQEKFKETLNTEIEDSPSRELQLEKKLGELLKEIYDLTGEISSLKDLLMEKDVTIDFLAHQLRCIHRYATPKTNKKGLYKNYKTLLDKYNKLCYNINTEEITDENY